MAFGLQESLLTPNLSVFKTSLFIKYDECIIKTQGFPSHQLFLHEEIEL